MSVVNPASMSSEERPVGLRARMDLVFQESVYQGELCWIVKDPVGMKYFRLKAPEFLVLSELKNNCSYQELKRLLERKFPEKITRLEAVQQLVISLHRNGLLISESIGQAKPLRKKRNKEIKQKAIGLLSSLISLKLPGFDPERLLTFIYPKLSWFFSPWFTAFVFAICLTASALVVGNLNEFYSRLPDFQSFFAFDNVLFMGAILIFTKTIHEFGHGLMCKHYGGECHEMGFMLLVLTPAMYCNTSDSWILPNRWHRMAIGAAGMYVEVFMAAICTFVWWFTNPGWIHYLALNIMFLSSVSTILFNANPLLRYDGYYILSDFLEIPNLAQKSKQALLSKLRVLCLGMKPINSRLLPSRHQVSFAIYSVASFVYRWAVMLMIFWFLAEVFEPWGLAVVGYLLTGISLIGMIVVPLFKLGKFFLYPGRLREVKKIRFLFTLACVAALAWFICYFPFPQFVYGSCVVRPLDPQMVFVREPGVLVSQDVAAGEKVVKGQVLAKLENREFDLELAEMEGELSRLQHELSGLKLNRNLYLDSESLIVQKSVELEELKKQLDIKHADTERLILRAKRSGVVMPSENVSKTYLPETELGRWTGSPLDPKNKFAFLDQNTLYCVVGDESKFETIIVVDQSDVKLIESSQQAQLVLEQYRDRVLNCSVSYVSRNELSDVARELSQTNGGPIAVKPSPMGGEKPVLKLYEVHAVISTDEVRDKQIVLASGYYGVAKIRVGQASLGHRALRYLRNLINFR